LPPTCCRKCAPLFKPLATRCLLSTLTSPTVSCASACEGTPEATKDVLRGAARAASPVGVKVEDPPVYPFSLHLTGPVHQVQLPTQRDGVATVELLADELTDLRTAYQEVARECANADRVATFAMGGIPAMQFATRLARNAYPDDDAFLAAVQDRQSRFHVFAGLLWTDDSRNEPIFTGWLDTLGPRARVLVFDTSFSGGAIGRIRNAIAAWAARCADPVPNIALVGVLDLGRLQRELGAEIARGSLDPSAEALGAHRRRVGFDRLGPPWPDGGPCSRRRGACQRV
jgi:hypothetical protein